MPSWSWDFRHVNGAELSKLGRFEEALACTERGLQIDPDTSELWRNKGIILKSLNEPEQASACFERMLGLKSHRYSYYELRDMIALFCDVGNLKSALKCCDAALKCNKLDADLWSHKAIILSKSGRYEEALASCKEGLAIEPRNHELWNIQAAVLLPLERFEEGLIACDRGIEIDTNYAALWENKGLILRALGKPQEAEKFFERAKAIRR